MAAEAASPASTANGPGLRWSTGGNVDRVWSDWDPGVGAARPPTVHPHRAGKRRPVTLIQGPPAARRVRHTAAAPLQARLPASEAEELFRDYFVTRDPAL